MASAPYGRPTGPLRVISQVPEVSGYRIVCCGYCSGQMAAWHVRPTYVASQMEAPTRSAHRSRALAGRPHNAGAYSSEVRAGTKAAMGVELVAASMATVRAALRAGKAAVYTHEYGALPAYLRFQGGSFGHSACLCYWTDANGGMAGWYDPLAPSGSRGIWAKWSDLQAAAWGGTQHSVTKLGAPAPPEPPTPEPPTPPTPGEPCIGADPVRSPLWGHPGAVWCAVCWAAVTVTPPPAPAPPLVSASWDASSWPPAPCARWGLAAFGSSSWAATAWSG